MWRYNANCYGYAANETRWLQVRDFRDEDFDPVDYFRHKMPNWRYVEHSEQLQLGKSYVAFKYGEYDFHFMKRGPKGHWRHKMGRTAVTSVSTAVVFSEVWDFGHNQYDSELYLFEVVG